MKKLERYSWSEFGLEPDNNGEYNLCSEVDADREKTTKLIEQMKEALISYKNGCATYKPAQQALASYKEFMKGE